MPREVKSKDEFEKMLPQATEIRLSKSGDTVKIKLRTEQRLYTFKTTEAEADALTKGTKLPVVEY